MSFARAERRRRLKQLAHEWEASIPLKMTPGRISYFAAKSKGQAIIVGGDGGLSAETFTNEYGTFNIYLLQKNIQRFPEMYGPRPFPIVEHFVQQVEAVYDLDPRYKDQPATEDDERRPIILVLERDGQWIADGVHRFIRLARAGKKEVWAWHVALDVMLRFRQWYFEDGKFIDDANREMARKHYGIWVDRNGETLVADNAREDLQRQAELIEKLIG